MVFNNIIKILDKFNATIITIFNKLCTPAKIEYVIGILSIVSLSFSCLTHSTESKISQICTIVIPHILTVAVSVYILNALCKGGASNIAWIIIIFPIISMILSIFTKKQKELYKGFNKKPALPVFLYPERNFEENDEQNKATIYIPSNYLSKKTSEGQIEKAGIDAKKIVSIRKHDDSIIVLFTNPDCTGDREVFMNNIPKLPSRWENNIGSIYIFRKKHFNSWSRNPVRVYQKPEYEGKSTDLWILPTEKTSEYNKNHLDFLGIRDNEISSIKIPDKKWIVKAYDQPEFRGKYRLFNDHQFKLDKKINNKITSIKISRKLN